MKYLPDGKYSQKILSQLLRAFPVIGLGGGLMLAMNPGVLANAGREAQSPATSAE
jgi:hypothetical protein